MNGGIVETILPREAGRLSRPADRIDLRDERAVLVSHSRPWFEMSLIEFLQPAAGTPRVYWESERLSVGFAGYGVAALLVAAGPDRFRTVRTGVGRLFDNAIHDTVDVPPPVGPRLFGGFAFQAQHTPEGMWAAFPAAYFVLPFYQLTRLDGRNWLTVNRLVREPRIANGELRAANGEWRTAGGELQRVDNGSRNGRTAIPNVQFRIHDSMSSATWCRMVRTAVDRIQRGELEKVVLARTCDVQGAQPVQPTEVLARLKRRYPDCYRFLIEPAPGHAFFGATPELLVEIEGSTLNTVAMAGSTARGDSPEADAWLARELMASPKERQEHAFVVSAIEASLRPLVKALHVPEQPTLRRLPNIQHLQTIIQGELADGLGVLPAVEALHPTPAVGGVSRTPALQMIAGEEPVPRGWYASPVGWIDSQGNGLFSVAIRSAVSVGTSARLYAGAGIVADSDPEREWEETGLKFRPMLEALEGISIP